MKVWSTTLVFSAVLVLAVARPGPEATVDDKRLDNFLQYLTPIATSKEIALYDEDNKVRDVRQAGGCGCDLVVYDHTNYGGRSLLIKQQNAQFDNDYFNDRVESAIVHGDCKWLLYEHHNFNGQTHLINPGHYPSSIGWGGNGNRITSARALPPQGTQAILLFQHSHFQGRMLVLYESNSHLPSLDFNDQLSSFIITGGHWTLYEHAGFHGRSATYGPGQYTAPPGSVGNDQISSVKKQ